MSSNPANRLLRLPPPDILTIKVSRTRQPARNWFRVHPARYPATFFSLNSVHRFSHPGCKFPFLYLAVDLDTCLFERFGDTAYNQRKTIAKSLWKAHKGSTIRLPELRVCDLTSEKTLSALMVDLSALMHTDLDAPQAWGLAIQQHSACFQAIKYRSRFNGKVCLALFQRDGIENLLTESPLDLLSKSGTAADWLDKHKMSLF